MIAMPLNDTSPVFLPIANDSDCEIPTKIDTFWNKFNHWQEKTGPFTNAARFQTPEALAGHSASWLNKYSKPFTEVLMGIAAVERP
jgi:hypothetical protein